jgi:hypothetical protein
MRHAVSNQLYAYWRGLKRGERPPERSAIEPGAIRAILADTFVLDFDPRAAFPFRISGSRINALFLRELRGTSFLQVWREADRASVGTILQKVAAREEPLLLSGETRPPGLAPIPIEVILLPLRHEGATHARLLGSLVMVERPDWLELVGAGPIALTACGRIGAATPDLRPQGVRRMASGARASAFSAPPTGLDGFQTPPSMRSSPSAKRRQFST